MDICVITKFYYTFFFTHIASVLPSEEQDILEALPHSLQRKAWGFVKESDKKAYLAGRMLLKRYVPNWASIQLNAWGKPFLQDGSLHFNLSHSGDWVVLALSDKGVIGTDIEIIRPTLYDNFAPCFSSNEWKNIVEASQPLTHFYKVWTQKESIVKADGRGLSIELIDVVIDAQGGYVKDTLPVRYVSDFFEISENCTACVSYPKTSLTNLVL